MNGPFTSRLNVLLAALFAAVLFLSVEAIAEQTDPPPAADKKSEEEAAPPTEESPQTEDPAREETADRKDQELPGATGGDATDEEHAETKPGETGPEDEAETDPGTNSQTGPDTADESAPGTGEDTDPVLEDDGDRQEDKKPEVQEEPIQADVDVQDCDRLAAHPADTNRKAEAVSFDTLKSQLAKAEEACRSATKDHPDVARFEFQLGRVLAAGGNTNEANEWYLKAAGRDYAAAMYNLALAYDEGTGIDKDQAVANRWYRKAADAGRAAAMWNLAINLDLGHGEPHDPVSSAFYLLLAYRSGFDKAVLGFEKELAGWRDATRREVQKALQTAGFYSGEINGRIDAATRSAAKAYRESS